jgi:hypothetical protein
MLTSVGGYFRSPMKSVSVFCIADKIITERMEVLENKMTREFDAKLKIVMDEQYHNNKK